MEATVKLKVGKKEVSGSVEDWKKIYKKLKIMFDLKYVRSEKDG